jgi:hypothetical protein
MSYCLFCFLLIAAIFLQWSWHGITVFFAITIALQPFKGQLMSDQTKEQQNFDNEVLLKAQQIFHEFLQEVDAMLKESQDSILDIKSTQNDAISTLSNSFTCLKTTTDFQNKCILELLENEIVASDKTQTEKLSQNNEALQKALNDAIRSLQFDDMNTQNLTFTAESLSFLQSQFLSLKSSQLVSAASDVSQSLQEIKEYRESRSNPVSANSVDDGGVDLF